MKKLIAIIFAISLIAPSPAQADAICDETCQFQKISNKYSQLADPIHKSNRDSLSKISLEYNNELQNINKDSMAKESLAQSSYNNALVKWKEIDQVMVNGSLRDTTCKEIVDRINNEITAGKRMGDFVKPYQVCKYEAPFYTSGFGLWNITLDPQDQNRRPNLPLSYMGKTLDPVKAGYGNAWIAGGPSNNVAHELIPSFPYQSADRYVEWTSAYPEYTRDFSWDFEQEYHPLKNNKTLVEATRIFVSFQYGWMWSVRNDGSRVSSAEFSMIRNNVKNAYGEIVSIRKQHTDKVNNLNTNLSNLMASIDQKYKQEIQQLTNSQNGEYAEIKWVTESNKQLISNFPATAKKELIKEGYFKPLKTFYWTCETGRYVASAEWLDQYTVAVGGYWETKTCKDVPTKKEQKTWMKKSEAKLAAYTNKYNSIIEQAKLRNLVVQCVAKNPCKISFRNN